MSEQLSTRSGSKLSGQRPGTAQLDLNRQMKQSLDPQGMYIFGADGTPYGFTNDHEPADITRLMDAALQRFQTNPPKPVTIPAADIAAPFSVTPPPSAQVLQVLARIPSPPNTCSILNNGVGRDFCWVYENERQAILRRSQSPVGSTFPLPASLVRRIARFHLVDDVRGTPNMWEAGEVRAVSLVATVVSASMLTVAGRFALKSSGGKRGYAGTLEGSIALDPATGRWTRVRLLADGTAFGAGTYTPNQPPTPYRLLVGFLNTSLPEARIVPPEEVATYNRDTRYRTP